MLKHYDFCGTVRDLARSLNQSPPAREGPLKSYLTAKWTSLPAPIKTWGPLWIALALLLAAYLATLQRDINGSDNNYMADVGEIQVALNLWGTIHYTGYPLYTMLGAAMVTGLRLIGLNPAVSASLPSTLFSLIALSILYALLLARTRRPWLAASIVLALGLTQTCWLHSVIAEVYSLVLLFTALIAWWVFKDERDWTLRDWLLSALILGFGIGHHRAVAFLIPGLAVWLAPQVWQQRRRLPLILLLGALVFAATFVVYLYLPVRAWAGAEWVYGQPGSWVGFWEQFTGAEAQIMMVPPDSAADLGRHITFIVGVLIGELTWPGLVIGVAALIGLLVRAGTRRLGTALLAGAASYLAFAIWLPEAVLALAFLMPVLLLIGLGAAEFAAHLADQTRSPLPAAAMLAGAGLLAAALFWTNLPFVRSLTTDDTYGRAVIERVAQLAQGEFEAEPVLKLPWSGPYFSVSYARIVTGELEGVTAVDHRASAASILDAGRPLITLPVAFYTFLPNDPSVWADAVHLTSVGPGLIRLSRQPQIASPEQIGSEVVPLGNGISMVDSSFAVRPDGAYWVTVVWRADEVPGADYNLFAHLLTTPDPVNPSDLLAQADTAAPVYGWYPTTRWSAGEVVRDDFLLTPPARYAGPIYLSVGMYLQQPDGSFQNYRALVRQAP